jgi:hypothetical protein
MATDVRRLMLESEEPWTRYRTLLDLEHLPPDTEAVQRARRDLIEHPQVRALIARAAEWPGYPLRRHNDAAHPLYAVSTLADFGLRQGDPGIGALGGAILDHFDGDQFETLLWLPRFLTKEDDAEQWSWMLCDAPTLLYALVSFGYGSEPSVRSAVQNLSKRIEDNGWRCGAAASLPKFSGPGRKTDTCPMATTYALKALSHLPADRSFDPAVDALLEHWEHQQDYKLRMFGIGTEFRKLKYPFVWYDILHVTDVLSRYPRAAADPRLVEMVAEVTAQADEDGRYTAGSMYRSWKEWSFADKKAPSPWLTLLVTRIQSRLGAFS